MEAVNRFEVLSGGVPEQGLGAAPNTVRIILSGFTDLKVVIDAVNRGSVFKFLTKPWE